MMGKKVQILMQVLWIVSTYFRNSLLILNVHISVNCNSGNDNIAILYIQGIVLNATKK